MIVGWALLPVAIVHVIGRLFDKAVNKCSLKGRFESLGTLEGWTYDEIVRAVYDPDSTYYKNGILIATWEDSECKFILAFDENRVCVEVKSA